MFIEVEVFFDEAGHARIGIESVVASTLPSFFLF